MKLIAKIKDIGRTLDGKYTLTLESSQIATDEAVGLSGEGMLDVEIKKQRKKRSLDANAMMWACLQQIAEKLRTDKWSVYLMMLKRYGQFTYACVKPNAKEAFMKQWRECEEVGEITINGEKAIQFLCYFGSSQYDTKEFSVLLDGIVSEMKEMGIEPPCSSEMRRLLEEWNVMKNGK